MPTVQNPPPSSDPRVSRIFLQVSFIIVIVNFKWIRRYFIPGVSEAQLLDNQRACYRFGGKPIVSGAVVYDLII